MPDVPDWIKAAVDRIDDECDVVGLSHKSKENRVKAHRIIADEYAKSRDADDEITLAYERGVADGRCGGVNVAGQNSWTCCRYGHVKFVAACSACNDRKYWQ